MVTNKTPSPIPQAPGPKPLTRSPPPVATGAAVGELELGAALPPNAVCCCDDEEVLVLAGVDDVPLVDDVSTFEISTMDASPSGRVSVVESVTAVGRMS